jgi:S-formylglutathione hydrolase FrmB
MVMMVRALLLTVVVVLALAGCGGGDPAPARAATTAVAAPPPPLTLTGTERIDARLTELTFSSPAISGQPLKVRVLTPDGAEPGDRFPALYLYAGTGGDASTWTRMGVEDATRGVPVVVVMPEADSDWCTNWAGGARPQWETFHVDQLIPWIDANEPVIAARSKRAIAGFSMGGFCAMSYAARHPELFAAASSFSGALDLGSDGGRLVGVEPWGPWDAEGGIAWRGSNPADLAANLRGIDLSMYTGDGRAGGGLGGGGPNDHIEPAIRAETLSFAARLAALGIPRKLVDYGRGGHEEPYFLRDLEQELPSLMDVFAHPADPPSPFSYTSTSATFAVRGWSVRDARFTLAFRTLSHARAAGFVLRTYGAATVTTPRRYARSARYRVVVRPLRAGAFRVRSAVLRSDAHGALTVSVPASASVGITRAAAES